MSWTLIILSIVVTGLVSSGVAILFTSWSIRRFNQIPTLESVERPCYRCGDVAVDQYMGLHYCYMCRQVVSMTIGAVGHDPPYGYPGSEGYLEFPPKEAGTGKESG